MADAALAGGIDDEGGTETAMAQAGSSAARRLEVWRHSLSPARAAGEATLIRAAQRGSEAAVQELFARHWPAAHRAALLVTGDRAAAEDIAQEAFLAAFRALGTFDLRRPLRPWLHRIVVNRAIDWSRARTLRGEVGADAAPEAASDVTQPLFDDEISQALQTLSPDHRAVIVLRYVLEFTPGEIGRMLGLPRGTVNSRLRRGLDVLRRALESTP